MRVTPSLVMVCWDTHDYNRAIKLENLPEFMSWDHIRHRAHKIQSLSLALALILTFVHLGWLLAEGSATY